MSEVETVMTALVNHFGPLPEHASNDECCLFVKAALAIKDSDFTAACAKVAIKYYVRFLRCIHEYRPVRRRVWCRSG